MQPTPPCRRRLETPRNGTRARALGARSSAPRSSRRWRTRRASASKNENSASTDSNNNSSSACTSSRSARATLDRREAQLLAEHEIREQRLEEREHADADTEERLTARETDLQAYVGELQEQLNEGDWWAKQLGGKYKASAA